MICRAVHDAVLLLAFLGWTATTHGAPSPAPASPRKPLLAPAAGSARRGTIRDVHGRVLIADADGWDVQLRYEVLAARDDEDATERLKSYLHHVAKGPKTGPGSVIRRARTYLDEVDRTWKRLATITGLTDKQIADKADAAVAQVQAIKLAVARAHGESVTIAEERSFRTVLHIEDEGIGHRLIKELAPLPWVRVKPFSRRIPGELLTPALVPLIGRVGTADARRVQAEANSARPVQQGDHCGISGVERMADRVLRPDRDETGLTTPGSDITLSIDAHWQEETFRWLKKGVDHSPAPSGGSAVVVDIRTGAIRALVSYPSHNFEVSPAEMDLFSHDNRWTPLRFRPVSGIYPPGSTVKPATLYAALGAGVVTPETTVVCKGVFRQDLPNAFRCWLYNRNGGTHGTQDAEGAIQNSCNIYFYTAGGKLGGARIIAADQLFGLGQTQGSGLVEEAAGILPTPEWLAKHRPKEPKYELVDAWNYALGQGEINVTPLQMANLAATIARGRFMPVTLLKSTPAAIATTVPVPGEPLEDKLLTIIRRGMWRVVNQKGGTADTAKLSHPGVTLCGKTGSAQTPPRVITTNFTFQKQDGSKVTVEAVSVDRAKKQVGEKGARLTGRAVASTYPVLEEGDPLPAHAWFIGYTQPAKTPKGAPPEGDSLAIAVLIEHGGAGGTVAAPVARDIIDHLLSLEKTEGNHGAEGKSSRSRTE